MFQHGLTVGWLLNAPWNEPLVGAWTTDAGPDISIAGDQVVNVSHKCQRRGEKEISRQLFRRISTSGGVWMSPGRFSRVRPRCGAGLLLASLNVDAEHEEPQGER